jgi:hypothetical protein
MIPPTGIIVTLIINQSELTDSQRQPTDERVTRIVGLGSWFMAYVRAD